MPWLDYLWKRNWLLPHWTKMNLIVAFGIARIQERQGKSEKADEDVNNKDFLSRFMEAESKDPQLPPEYVAPAVSVIIPINVRDIIDAPPT